MSYDEFEEAHRLPRLARLFVLEAFREQAEVKVQKGEMVRETRKNFKRRLGLGTWAPAARARLATSATGHA